MILPLHVFHETQTSQIFIFLARRHHPRRTNQIISHWPQCLMSLDSAIDLHLELIQAPLPSLVTSMQSFLSTVTPLLLLDFSLYDPHSISIFRTTNPPPVLLIHFQNSKIFQSTVEQRSRYSAQTNPPQAS